MYQLFQRIRSAAPAAGSEHKHSAAHAGAAASPATRSH